MTIKECVRKYTNDLKLVTHIPAKEVEMLIMYLLDKNPIWLHLNYNNEFLMENELKKLVTKRATNYPLEYITKKASFYGEQFIVNEGVLIPRPETELLVENAFNILKEQKDEKLIVEIGTGSGIISVMLAVLLKNIKIIAVDINEKALNLAKQNAQKFGVLERIDFRFSNLFEKVDEKDIFMVVSNPPYIKDDYVLKMSQKLSADIIRLNTKINLENIPCNFLSVSIGIVTRIPQVDTLTAFYKKVDEALYDAKKLGRNCISFNGHIIQSKSSVYEIASVNPLSAKIVYQNEEN